MRRLRLLAAQPLRQQRRIQRLLQRTRNHRFDTRIGHVIGRPHTQLGHACQHLVTGTLCGFRMTVRTQTTWRLRQHRQQGRFGLRQMRGGFAQIRPTRRFHAFDGAAIRRAFQIQIQNLVLAQMHFQLHRTQQLFEFAPRRARVRIEDARHLHGERGAAGDNASLQQPLLAGAQQRPRIDARMPPEPAVLVSQ
ncbi:hypothetical protein D3C71_1413210 [compost metagenome]